MIETIFLLVLFGGLGWFAWESAKAVMDKDKDKEAIDE